MVKSEQSLEQLSRRVGERLLQKHWKVATAESCTGGGVAYLLTAIPGSSDWFEDGFVVYANRSKRERLGVSEATLATEGAVSEACVRELAQGACRESGANCAIAISGIAGPGGGTAEKPVGLVWFAWRVGERLSSRSFRIDGGRREVRLEAIRLALEGLLERLENV